MALNKNNSNRLQEALALRPECRKKSFVRQMIGNDLERVSVEGYIPRRRKESLQPEKLDTRNKSSMKIL